MSADVHTLIGAWALDAVDDQERRLIEAHLDECASCAQEAAELREAVARLSDVTVADPPARLRGRVLAEVRRTRQAAPAATEPEPEPPQQTAPPRPRRARLAFRPPRLRLALGAAAIAVVAAFAGVVATWALLHQQAVPSEADRIAAVLEAADAEVAQAEPDGGGQVTVISSASLDEAVVVIADLASPGADRSYQVWMVDDAGQVSAGVMDAGDSSATMLIEDVGDTDLIGVTEEPAGGSDTPTLPLIAGVPLDA
ncbi:anti-sigma factor [Glycomyces terrestris]|uniref:Regulator of SigK n=1 Tax=Glycomyces terrestris TaxID=2493553 RepID=A0A426UTC0_9ACTN|nr:anti-sigma factor [Glycomyces terrestris]RRR96785.1 anti-sigma factor [Glycomyces terrestris]